MKVTRKRTSSVAPIREKRSRSDRGLFLLRRLAHPHSMPGPVVVTSPMHVAVEMQERPEASLTQSHNDGNSKINDAGPLLVLQHEPGEDLGWTPVERGKCPCLAACCLLVLRCLCCKITK